MPPRFTQYTTPSLTIRVHTATPARLLGRLIRGVAIPAITLAWSACGSGGGPGTGPTNAGFAGTYGTQVTLTSNSCGTIVVQDNLTIVTYDPASRAVSLTHAGTTYQGSVANDSTFSTPARDVTVGDGFLYRIALAGRFRTNAFDADATVGRSGMSTPACQFVAHWAASK